MLLKAAIGGAALDKVNSVCIGRAYPPICNDTTTIGILGLW